MPAILTPALALRHLRELSTDLRAAVALAPDGAPVAGDAAIQVSARALLTALGEQRDGAVRTARGNVLIAHAPDVTFVVVAGPHALAPLLEHDVRTLLEAGSGPFKPLPAAAEPALEALFLAADAVFAG